MLYRWHRSYAAVRSGNTWRIGPDGRRSARQAKPCSFAWRNWILLRGTELIRPTNAGFCGHWKCVCLRETVPLFLKHTAKERPFEIEKKIMMERPRAELYERIDRRADEMMKAGLLEEARSLYPYKNSCTPNSGVQELFAHFDGEYSTTKRYALSSAIRAGMQNVSLLTGETKLERKIISPSSGSVIIGPGAGYSGEAEFTCPFQGAMRAHRYTIVRCIPWIQYWPKLLRFLRSVRCPVPLPGLLQRLKGKLYAGTPILVFPG